MRINLDQYTEMSPTLTKLVEELDEFSRSMRAREGKRPTYMKLSKVEIDNLVNELPLKNLCDSIRDRCVFLFGVRLDFFI